jgi:hypothetical protein
MKAVILEDWNRFFPGVPKSVDFSVRAACDMVVSFSDNPVLRDHDRTHHGVRACPAVTLCSEAKRFSHEEHVAVFV